MADLITIATFQSMLEADSARRKLEQEGVQTFLADEHIVSMVWIYSQAVGGIRLQVSSDDEQKAKEILSRPVEKIDVEHKSDSGEGVVCPVCQSDNIRKERYSRGVAAISWFFLGFPLPFPAVRYKCFYCDHEWNEKLQIPAPTKKIFPLTMVVLAAIVVFLFFKFIYTPPASAVRVLPESAFSWNAELNEKDGDLISLLENFQARSLLGYTLYRGENILQSTNGWGTDLFDMMTRQEEENVFREIFAGFQPVATSDLYNNSPVLIHVAIVRDLPLLPLNVSKEDAGLLQSPSYSRDYTRGPLKDSNDYGFYDVDIIASGRGYHYTLFYVHKKNLLFEVAVPGRLNYAASNPSAANFDSVFLTIQGFVEDSGLDVVDFISARGE